MKKREYAIDFLKFFAALLITNSHLEVFDPTYPLATGGSIGDVLFLFCSGYTLFMGKMGRFDNWYKRRLNRIFPPVICWGIISAFCFGAQNSIDRVIVNGGGWFVQCILLYYILAYPIRKYMTKYLSAVFGCAAAAACIWYLVQRDNIVFLYGWNYCKWAVFFYFSYKEHRRGFRRPRIQGIIDMGSGTHWVRCRDVFLHGMGYYMFSRHTNSLTLFNCSRFCLFLESHTFFFTGAKASRWRACSAIAS